VLANHLRALKSGQEASETEAMVLEALRTYTQKDPVFVASYALLDLSGRNVIDTETVGVGRDESVNDYFIEALETGLAYVSSITFESSSGNAAMRRHKRAIHPVA
jgi:hypothetical protein